jgi:hypothetical protein
MVPMKEPVIRCAVAVEEARRRKAVRGTTKCFVFKATKPENLTQNVSTGIGMEGRLLVGRF